MLSFSVSLSPDVCYSACEINKKEFGERTSTPSAQGTCLVFLPLRVENGTNFMNTVVITYTIDI